MGASNLPIAMNQSVIVDPLDGQYSDHKMDDELNEGHRYPHDPMDTANLIGINTSSAEKEEEEEEDVNIENEKEKEQNGLNDLNQEEEAEEEDEDLYHPQPPSASRYSPMGYAENLKVRVSPSPQ